MSIADSQRDVQEDEADLVFKALGDRRRRRILDVLKAGPQTTGDLCARFEGDLDRCTVMQHIGVLEKAGLLIGVREGRQRWNHLNIAPVQDVHARWIAPYAAEAAGLLHRPKTDHFEVVVIGAEPLSAQLYLCGRPAKPLPWKGDRYDVHVPADCEGGGRIMVRGADGSSAACAIRYVSPRLDAYYRFALLNGVCRIR